MLTPTLICIAIAILVGIISAAWEKLFLVIVFVGLPALGFSMKFMKGVSLPFHAPDGNTHMARLKDLFFQIPDEYRLGVYLFVPIFIASRMITTSMIKAQQSKTLTPDQIRAKKRKILKSYTS